ncbi:hypothetical protein FOZ60_007930 [Perkinsus olseni]|uniref:Uncharacterized protein n=1 Tax=Perkinsus olseni TaxID=32597 RepID=A0A7J6NKL4_PEROL|nr:hypothetical protein FOZ60_007930 [Perkinsus olseni]
MDCWVICDKNKAGFKLKARGDDHNLQMVACEGEYRSISLHPGSRKKEKKTNPSAEGAQRRRREQPLEAQLSVSHLVGDDSSVPRSNGKNRRLTVHLGDGENPSYFFKVVDDAGKVCLKVVRSQAAGANTEGDILGLTYKEPFNTAAAFGITTAVMTAWKESHPSGNLLRRLMKKCTTSVPKSPEELLKVAKGAVVCGVMKKKISEKK